MAISGQENINIGVQNGAVGSDSLYAAFTKTQNNFSQLFSYASPYTTFIGSNGLDITANSSSGTVTVTNTGVTDITAGTGITLNKANGNIIISASGNGLVGVTSVGVTSSTLTVTESPIISSGNINVELPDTGVYADTYISPTITIDRYGRITSAANTTSVGTVTNVEVAGGVGIEILGGPITDSGMITVTNTGVTSLSAGTGIVLSSSNGAVTIMTADPAPIEAVTSVGILSNSLVVSDSPVTLIGNINVELPNNISLTGNLDASFVLQSVTDSITANGSANVDATQLSSQLNIVLTSSSGANGVSLPSAVPGISVKIVNVSGDTVRVYPDSGSAINGLSTDSPFTMSSNARVEFTVANSTQWYTFP